MSHQPSLCYPHKALPSGPVAKFSGAEKESMQNRLVVRVYACIATTAFCVLAAAAPAAAQFRPQPMNEPAPGEQYHIEGSAALWWPSADISVASSGFNNSIIGTTIDLRNDLGLVDQRFPELSLVLRPAQRHKFRFQYIPINFTQTANPSRTIVFNGQRFDVSIPVESSLDWKAFRFGYEYDFLVKNDWFAGFILEAKYTDVQATLTSPLVGTEFAHAQAPIPALGGIGRYYIVPAISITGEVTAFKLPTVQSKYAGHFVDVDIYGTVSWTKNVGTQIGFRSMDVGYLVKRDTGNMTLKGLYVGIVARY
jgi:hypothetical protein